MKQKTETASTHHPHGPSSLNGSRDCPGFFSASGESEAALQGTRLHEFMETGDESLVESDYEQSLVDYALEQQAELILRHLPVVSCEDLREILLNVELGAHSTFGTCDRCIIAGDCGLLVDYKFGVHKVPYPEENLQAIAYSVGAFQKFPRMRKLVFAFIAPKRGEVHYCHFHRDELATLKTELKGVIRTAMRVRKQLERGIVSRGTLTMLRPDSLRCEYCAFNDGRCPATADYAADCADDKPPSESLAELNEQLKRVPLLEAYISAVKQRAREMVLEYGEELADFRVETRAGARSITSVDAAWAEAEQAGVDIADFLAIVKTLPITHYEKLFGDKDKTREALKNLAAEGALTSGEEVHYLKRRI